MISEFWAQELLSKSKNNNFVCTTYVVYYTTFVVYKKYFFQDFGIKTMPKIQELFIFSESKRIFSRFQLEIRFSNLASMNHLYSLCLLYTIPQMWYTMHNLYTTYVEQHTTNVVQFTTYVVYYITFDLLNKMFFYKQFLNYRYDFLVLKLKNYSVYCKCCIVYQICGNFVQHMWYSIEHLWHT